MKYAINALSNIFPWHLHPSQLFEMAIEFGIDRQELISISSLIESDLDKPDLHICWDQYREIANLVDWHGSSDWAFEFGKRLTLGSHGIISLAIMNCSNWRQIIELIVEYKVLVTSLFRLRIIETNDYVHLTVQPEFSRDALHSRFIETFFTILYTSLFDISRFKDDIMYQPNNICIFLKEDKPLYSKKMAALFHQNIQWNHFRNELRINKELIDKNIGSSNPVAAKNMIQILKVQLSQLPARSGIIHELHALFEEGLVRQEECSTPLYASVPTLKRHLRDAHTSFSQELTHYRIESACHELIYTDLSIGQISDNLGFQNPDSFRKLFKSETGVTASQFRELYLQKI